MKCSRCNKNAVYEARYSGENLCGEHLLISVERRIKKEVREQINFDKPVLRISVAISGGKDSSVTLYVLNDLFHGRKNVSLEAFTIDEGIEGYRNSGLESARKMCSELDIPHHTVSFRDTFGTTMDRIVGGNPDIIPCSRCGPMRRHLMNDESIALNSDYVALGINLDDYSQSILMNVARGDVIRMSRMAPHYTARDGLVRRILPLRRIPEKEVMLYAVLRGIEFDASWCPYYEKAQRNSFREVLEIMEERSPGTKFAMLNFLDGLRPVLGSVSNEGNIRKCKICGQPTSREICATCSIVEN